MNTNHLNRVAAQVAVINSAIQALFMESRNKRELLARFNSISERMMSQLLNAQTPDSFVKEVEENISLYREFLKE